MGVSDVAFIVVYRELAVQTKDESSDDFAVSVVLGAIRVSY
jgi:uncharacterized membrane protein (DUF373 family)